MAKKRSKHKKPGAKYARAKRQQSPEGSSSPDISRADEIAGQGGFDLRGILRSDALAGVSYVLKIWLVSRLVLTGVGVFARSWIGQVDSMSNVQRFGVGSGQPWLDIWSAWDSRFYYFIADMGYPGDPSPDPLDPTRGYSIWAFFPLYPWLTRLVEAPIGSTYIGGLIVSNVALIVGAWFLYKLVELSKDTETAKKAALFLFLFPTAYVFSCLMTEGLFLALTVGAWYFARKGNWFLAGILGMLSAATRLVGVLMAPLLGLEYLRQRKWRIKAIRPNALWLGLVPVGVLIFMVACYYKTGNPLMFADAQYAWVPPEDSHVNPIRTVHWGLAKYLEDPFDWRSSARMGLGYGVACTVAVVGLLFWGRKRIGNLLFFWSLGMVLVPLASHIQMVYPMPRFLAVIFPIYLILATIRSRSAAFYTVAVAFGLLQAMTMSMWTTGRSFAT